MAKNRKLAEKPAKQQKMKIQPALGQQTYGTMFAKQTKISGTKLKTINFIVPILILIGMLVFMGTKIISLESEVLFKSQELDLWIDDPTFYNTFSIYPGGWLSWIGSYMTQFFYHPSTGVWLLMGAWAIIMAMLAWMYRLKGARMLLVAAVPIMLLAAFTQTGYWIYYQKLNGHMWVPTLGVLFSILAALAYHKILPTSKCIISCFERKGKVGKDKVAVVISTTLRSIYIVLFAWFGYIYLGSWVLGGLAIMAFPTRRLHIVELAVPAIVAAVGAYFFPRIMYNCGLYEQTIFSEIYHACMPCFRTGDANVVLYRKAYTGLVLSFLPIALACWWPCVKERVKNSLGSKMSQLIPVIVAILVLFFASSFAKERWNHDKNFHAEVTMSNAIDRQDWETVLTTINECADDTIAPTRAMTMMKNLALYRLGRIGNEMFLYPEGSELQNQEEYNKYGDSMYDMPEQLNSIEDPEKKELESIKYKWNIRLTQIAGKLLYYNYGKLNFCYRWCMEDAVEFGWKVEQLKLMALCSILKGEDKVAKKYIDILKKTRYHREWAEKYEAFIGKPDMMKEDPELKPICYLKEYGDRLDGDMSVIEIYLLKTFANANGVDPYYQEMTLISALIMKDIQLFWPRFLRYATMHNKEKGFKMPRYYQEAAYLYGQLEPQSAPDNFANMPFDKEVVDGFKRFMAYNNRREIAGLSDEKKAEMFKPQFGNTFYYFYFLVRNQKTN